VIAERANALYGYPVSCDEWPDEPNIVERTDLRRVMTVVGRGGLGKNAMVCRLLKALEAGGCPTTAPSWTWPGSCTCPGSAGTR
jgi:hypothetical protein